MCDVKTVSFAGKNEECTNFVSAFLLDLAGNPNGTYYQEELCIYCGADLQEPEAPSYLQRLTARLVYSVMKIQRVFYKPHPNWIHVLFEKRKE